MTDSVNRLKDKEDILVLAIETSCDETAASVVRNGREVLSSVIYSQIDIHKEFGGVVPEIASRNHVEKLPYIVRNALLEAKLTFDDIDAFAVTYGPGLVGALLTGVSYAKTLAYCLNKPLYAINHMEGHISANYISHMDLEPPFLCLLASGGHSNIIHVRDYCDYEVIASSRDDAVGEAFDKVARVIGLEYPGGPNVEKLAKSGNADAFHFPRPLRGEETYDFSFSGIKTAVINLVRNAESRREPVDRADVAASFQKCAVTYLRDNLIRAARDRDEKVLVLGGGVSANGALRDGFGTLKDEFRIYYPELRYCTDNAAMIASAAYYRIRNGDSPSELTLNADPGLEI